MKDETIMQREVLIQLVKKDDWMMDILKVAKKHNF